MRFGAIVLVLVLTAPSVGAAFQASAAACATWQECRDAVEAALAEDAFDRAHDLAWRAVQTGPKDDPALMFLLARAQSRAGRPQDALVMIRRLSERGVGTDALENPDLERMRALEGWAEVEPLVARSNSGQPMPGPAAPTPPKAAAAAAAPAATTPAPKPPAARSSGRRAAIPIESATVSEDLLRFSSDNFTPSGLAYDKVSSRFVIGDRLGRKLRVVGEGLDHAVDLVRAESAGFFDIRALAIDIRRGDLWVTTSDASGSAGTLHRIQLISGRPLQSLQLSPESGRSIRPVDLAIADSGAVFLLDQDGRIQRVRPGNPAIETIAAPQDIQVASSLALASGDAVAYVAHAAGLLRVELRSGAATVVTSAAELPLTGLERLRVHRTGFVALQRSPDGGSRLLRLELNRTGRAVRAATTYDIRVEVGSPAAFAVSGDEVSIVSGDPAGAAEGDTPPAAGPPAEHVVRRYRLR
jgi:hypothetical protein